MPRHCEDDDTAPFDTQLARAFDELAAVHCELSVEFDSHKSELASARAALVRRRDPEAQVWQVFKPQQYLRRGGAKHLRLARTHTPPHIRKNSRFARANAHQLYSAGAH